MLNVHTNTADVSRLTVRAFCLSMGLSYALIPFHISAETRTRGRGTAVLFQPTLSEICLRMGPTRVIELFNVPVGVENTRPWYQSSERVANVEIGQSFPNPLSPPPFKIQRMHPQLIGGAYSDGCRSPSGACEKPKKELLGS
ncbi:hypothetical protein BU25DRAFT_139797 [Macroventuria anomochaeta]|uniref:Uncharacterized protein n=1 Tax=Macroventuria anomochaeta TaxID=301207 RepID=A0ACB6SEQ2_9PLEO|nr:uncharacterized protein BU25DRAFT_139797 [Macroventuria anomochaeta]KAF2632080.1 hypothetical protein BU25DRAFT_139797 [Macroventuria anomochaeta]